MQARSPITSVFLADVQITHHRRGPRDEQALYVLMPMRRNLFRCDDSTACKHTRLTPTNFDIPPG
jgi:hypothetical protein